jgi:hypothetical protein
MGKGKATLGNYDHSVLGQKGHGHWSPVVAYESKTGSCLVLDVARYKYEPGWVALCGRGRCKRELFL